jgi:hypothetical protein
MVWWILAGIFAVVLLGIAVVGIKEKDASTIPVFFGVLGVGSLIFGLATIFLMIIGSAVTTERHFSHTERYKIVENSPIENDGDLEVFVYDANGVISEMDIYPSKLTISGKNHIVIDHYVESADWAVPWRYSLYTEAKIID